MSLVAAAQLGKWTEVARLARENPNSVVETTSQGWSAAHYAARKGDLEMMQCLFQCSPSVLRIRTGDMKETPAHKAASVKNRALLLWMHQVDPHLLDLRDDLGRSAIDVLSGKLDQSEAQVREWLHPAGVDGAGAREIMAGAASGAVAGSGELAGRKGDDVVLGGTSGLEGQSAVPSALGPEVAAGGRVLGPREDLRGLDEGGLAVHPHPDRAAGGRSAQRTSAATSAAATRVSGQLGVPPDAAMPVLMDGLVPSWGHKSSGIGHGGKAANEGDDDWRDAELRDIETALAGAFGMRPSRQMMAAWGLDARGDSFSELPHPTEDGKPLGYASLTGKEKGDVDKLLASNQKMDEGGMELAAGCLLGTEWEHFNVYYALALARSTDAEDKVSVREKLREYSLRLGPEGWDPAILLAAARAAELQGWSDERKHTLLAIYDTLFKKQAEALMSPSDRTFLKVSRRETGSASAPSASEADSASSVEGQWAQLRSDVPSAAMDELMKMIGLQSVKRHALSIIKKLLADQKLSARQRVPTSINFSFMGNPGTGKTVVARLFGAILHQVGLRKSPRFTDTTGQQMVQDGAMKADEVISTAMDGVLFIDEAHSLDPGSNRAEGRAIVTKLLKAAEDHRERITIILAGYQDEIENKLYASDQGFRSRFEDVFFHDYTEAELKQIFEEKVREKDWTLDPASPRLADVVARRIARGRGTKGFANARTVRSTMERGIKAASLAERAPLLKIEDFLGARPDPEQMPKLNAALNELWGMVGLDEQEGQGEGKDRTVGRAVKPAIRQLLKTVQANYDRELRGEKDLQVSLNRLFLGSPGTGKTTVAAVYGNILKELGLLSNGTVVMKTAGDFVAGHEGGTEEATLAILENARGKVLVIDEAYNLNGSKYGSTAIDMIVSKVMGGPGDDIAVVMLGYEKEMLKMLRDQNPGLARRFQPADAFFFPDFDDGELMKILKAKAAQEQLRLGLDVRTAAIKLLAEERRKPNFGNAGAVNNLLSRAKLNMSARDPRTRSVEVADLGSSAREAGGGGDPLDELRSMFKTDKIEAELEQLQADVEDCRARGEQYEVENYLFVGPPGTGKTVVARLMARMVSKLGVLENRVVETTAQEIQGEYLGQSQAKARELMSQACGGVLFVDEAHNFGSNGPYAIEAAKVLMTATLEPAHKGRTMIILAGYQAEMDRMLNSVDPGMRRRFKKRLEFSAWSAEDCTQFLEQLCKHKHLAIDSGAVQHVLEVLRVAKDRPGWGNASDAHDVFSNLLKALALRRRKDPTSDLSTVTLSDARDAMRKYLEMRPAASAAEGATVLEAQFPEGFDLSRGANAGGPPPLSTRSVALREEVAQLAQTSEGGGGDEEIFAALQLACVELGYDKDQESRRRLVAILKAVQAGGAFAEDIIEHVQSKVGCDSATLNRVLRPQVASMLASVEQAVATEEARLEEIRRLEREKKIEEVARKEREHKAMQQKLLTIGACPAGFSWYRQSGGWRCMGGAHWVTDAELNKYFSH